MSEVLCPLPFVNIHILPNGHVYPCCSWKREPYGNINREDIENIWNNNKFKKLRNMMIENQWPAGCASCKIKEQSGFKNMRLLSHEVHDNFLINETLPTKFDEWDIRNSNLCNLKCQTCDALYSSLHNEGVELKVPNDQLYKIIDRDVKTVKKIYFAGGEPLINDFHYYVIEKLIENNRSDCWLQYSTNLTKLDYRKYNIIDKWKFFDKVNVFASIDSLGSKNETIRENSNWNVLEKNFAKLSDAVNEKLKLWISVTVSKLNVADVPDIYFYFKEKNIPITFHNILVGPRKFRFDAMNNSEIDVALTNLSQYISCDDKFLSDVCVKLTGAINRMVGRPE